MPEQKSNEISRDHLAEPLNEDLSREYQAIIAYVVYSQVLKGAAYMDIAATSSFWRIARAVTWAKRWHRPDQGVHCVSQGCCA